MTEVARDLSIARSLLQRWREQLVGGVVAPTPALPRQRGTNDRVRGLGQRLRDVTEKRDVCVADIEDCFVFKGSAPNFVCAPSEDGTRDCSFH